MQNPFKKDEAVLTKVKRNVVEATVTQTWKNEVQVKTTDGDLFWRTMYTVWRAGEAPLARDQKAPKPHAGNAGANSAPPAKVATPGQRAKTKKSSAKPSNKRR